MLNTYPSRMCNRPTSIRWSWLKLATLAFGLSSVASSTAADPAQVIDQFFQGYRLGNVETMLSAYAPDATFVDVNQRHEATGQAALHEMFGRLVAIHKVMNVEVKRRAVTGNLVAVEVVYSGTLDCAALGRPDHPDLAYSLPAALLFEIKNGRIQRQTDYLDFRTFTETFAALQPPQSD